MDGGCASAILWAGHRPGELSKNDGGIKNASHANKHD